MISWVAYLAFAFAALQKIAAVFYFLLVVPRPVWECRGRRDYLQKLEFGADVACARRVEILCNRGRRDYLQELESGADVACARRVEILCKSAEDLESGMAWDGL